MLKTPPIFDVYELEAPVAWASMNPRPALAILKASGKFSDGVRREDHQVENYAAQCRALQIPIGLYHFLLPNNITEQADLFLSVWNRLGADVPPIVDVECDPSSFGISKITWGSQIKTWLDLVESATGQKSIIYTSRYYWSFTYVTTPPAWVNDYPLWVAWYPNQPDQFSAPPASVLPGGWNHWEIWQYSPNGRSNGLLANDLNIGSLEFMASIGIPDTEPNVHMLSFPLSGVELSVTPYRPDDIYPLLSCVEQAQASGWIASMNCGAGFDYTDATHAQLRTTGFQFITLPNGQKVYYARRAIGNGYVNSELSDNPNTGPWCMLGYDLANVYLIVTDGSAGFTQLEAAQWAVSKGITDCYLMDSDRSAQIERDGAMIYWPYGPAEKVPQCLGIKHKTSGGTVKGTANSNVNVKSTAAGGAVLDTLVRGEVVYGDYNDAHDNLVKIFRIYMADGVTVRKELPSECKVSIGSWITVTAGTDPNSNPSPDPDPTPTPSGGFPDSMQTSMNYADPVTGATVTYTGTLVKQ